MLCNRGGMLQKLEVSGILKKVFKILLTSKQHIVLGKGLGSLQVSSLIFRGSIPVLENTRHSSG